jgi:hypothetical protein
VMRRGLDGGGAKHGQGEGGGDQLVHGHSPSKLESRNAGHLMLRRADAERGTCNRHQAG